MSRGIPSRAAVASAAAFFFLFAVGAAVGLRLLRHNLFYDETIHLHIVWAVSSGLRPFRDFFFESPVLAHTVLSPLFRFLPEGGYLVLLFRAVSASLSALVAALLWRHGRRVSGSGLFGAVPFFLILATPEMGRFAVEFSPDHLAMVAAGGAFLLLFGEAPRSSRVAWASALCVLSVSFNPKYAAPLALGGAGFLAAAILGERRWRAPVGWGVFGAASVLAAQWAIFALSGVSALDAIRWGFVFPARYHAAVLGHVHDATLGWQVLLFLKDNLLVGGLLASGLLGWVAAAIRRPAPEWLPAAGVLAGTAYFSFTTWSNLEQYLFPMLVSLCFFAPYGTKLFSGGSGEGDPAGGWRGWLPAAWAAAGSVAAILLVLDAAGIRPRTQGTHYFRKEIEAVRAESALEAAERIDAILSAIPRGERVIGLWFHNPIFRRDLTRIHCDELDSFAMMIPPGEPEREWFSPDTLLAALRASPPGYVGTFQLQMNFPPGWHEVLIRFLEENADRYQTVPTRYGGVFVRKDLYTPGLDRRLK